MSSELDPSEFVDGDYQATRQGPAGAPAPGALAAETHRAPSRAEVETKVTEAQQKLAHIQQEKEVLERERAAWEEARRRLAEWQTGRQEMMQSLIRGLGLLEEAELSARREAEQMAKTISALRDALEKVRAIQEESWTQENFQPELTRALTVVENARKEWNSARLKFAVLSDPPHEADAPAVTPGPVGLPLAGAADFRQMCKMGLALTWPVAVVLLALLLLWLIQGK